MKKAKLILFTIISFIILNSTCYAECTNKDKVLLGKIAAQVKVSYEEVEEPYPKGTFLPPEGYEGDPEEYVVNKLYFKINAVNITNDVYVKITNNVNSDTKTIKYSDTDNGVYSFNQTDLSKVTTYNYTIYGSIDSSCYDTEIRKGVITLPKFNPVASTMICSTLKDNALCQKYLSADYDYEYIVSSLNKILDKQKKGDEKKNIKKNESPIKKVTNFINKNKKAVLITGISTATIVGIVIVILIRRKRSRVL